MKNTFYILTSLIIISSIVGCKESPKKESGNKDNSPIEKVDDSDILSELDKINEEIVEDPMNPNGYYKRSIYYKNKYDFYNAIEDIDRALKITPDVAELNYQKGDILFNKAGAEQNPDLYEQSLTYLNQTIKMDSTHTDALILLSRLNSANKSFDKALDNLSTVLRYDEYNAKAYFWKGVVFEKIGEIENAASSYQTAIEQDANYAAAHNHLGLLYANSYDPIALDYYNAALAIEPGSFEVLRNKALLLKDLEKYQESISVFKQLTADDSLYSEGYYNIGNTYISMYRDNMDEVAKDSITKNAIFYFEKAIQVQPEYIKATFNLGVVNAFIGNKEIAKTNFEKVLELDENNEDALKAINEL
ncbi:MAG: tetratricopeptide (TPR) repeat protein [Flavobacteriales bacterium]|jgi:tetratricopeptide (TPR) repeat protein